MDKGFLWSPPISAALLCVSPNEKWVAWLENTSTIHVESCADNSMRCLSTSSSAANASFHLQGRNRDLSSSVSDDEVTRGLQGASGRVVCLYAVGDEVSSMVWDAASAHLAVVMKAASAVEVLSVPFGNASFGSEALKMRFVARVECGINCVEAVRWAPHYPRLYLAGICRTLCLDFPHKYESLTSTIVIACRSENVKVSGGELSLLEHPVKIVHSERWKGVPPRVSGGSSELWFCSDNGVMLMEWSPRQFDLLFAISPREIVTTEEKSETGKTVCLSVDQALFKNHAGQQEQRAASSSNGRNQRSAINGDPKGEKKSNFQRTLGGEMGGISEHLDVYEASTHRWLRRVVLSTRLCVFPLNITFLHWTTCGVVLADTPRGRVWLMDASTETVCHSLMLLEGCAVAVSATHLVVSTSQTCHIALLRRNGRVVSLPPLCLDPGTLSESASHGCCTVVEQLEREACGMRNALNADDDVGLRLGVMRGAAEDSRPPMDAIDSTICGGREEGRRGGADDVIAAFSGAFASIAPLSTYAAVVVPRRPEVTHIVNLRANAVQCVVRHMAPVTGLYWVPPLQPTHSFSVGEQGAWSPHAGLHPNALNEAAGQNGNANAAAALRSTAEMEDEWAPSTAATQHSHLPFAVLVSERAVSAMHQSPNESASEQLFVTTDRHDGRCVRWSCHEAAVVETSEILTEDARRTSFLPPHVVWCAGRMMRTNKRSHSLFHARSFGVDGKSASKGTSRSTCASRWLLTKPKRRNHGTAGAKAPSLRPARNNGAASEFDCCEEYSAWKRGRRTAFRINRVVSMRSVEHAPCLYVVDDLRGLMMRCVGHRVEYCRSDE